MEENNIKSKNIQKVVTTDAKTKKRSSLEKAAGSFFSEDVGKVKEYVLDDILIPTAKKTLQDIITNAVEIVLYGSSGKRSDNGYRYPGERVSYAARYQSPDRRYDQRYAPQRTAYSYDDVVFASRGDAERVLTEMYNIIQRYGVVTVSDFQELAGVTGSYTDNNYGWTDLRYAEPQRVRDGYIIKLPKPMPID